MTYELDMGAVAPSALFGRLVMQVHRLWRRELDHALEGHGLSQATALPMLILLEKGCLRQNALAEALGIEGPSLVRLLDLLAAEGFLERREDASDRRARTLHLTPAGLAKAREIEAVVQKVRTHLLSDVVPEDLKVAMDVLRTVEARLQREAEARRPGAEGAAS